MQASTQLSIDSDQIKKAIQAKYAEVSVSASEKFAYPIGREGARSLGYDPMVLHGTPEWLLVSFCGVGNPFLLGNILPNKTVLDYGCGVGFDLFVASGLVGPKGSVCGIDLTGDMVRRAKENLTRAGIRNFEVKQVDSENIPYESGFFDVVISNGVINLVPEKEQVFCEIHRVLKPGGRLQFADVVVEKPLPLGMAGSAEAWSQ